MEQTQNTKKPKNRKSAGPVKRALLTILGLALAGSGGHGVYTEAANDALHIVSTPLNVAIALLGLILIYRYVLNSR